MQSEHEIHEMAARMVAGAISRSGSGWLEVLHIAKEVFGHVKDAVEDLVEDEKRKKR